MKKLTRTPGAIGTSHTVHDGFVSGSGLCRTRSDVQGDRPGRCSKHGDGCRGPTTSSAVLVRREVIPFGIASVQAVTER